MHESLCGLYVAMTRAVHALYLVIAPQAPTKNGTTSYYKKPSALLRAALVADDRVPASTTLREIGDPDWLDRIPGDVESPAEPVTAAPRRGPVAFTQRAGGRSRGRETRAPSQSKQSAGVAASHLLSQASASGMDRGTLWHRWCQEVRWTEDGPIDRARLLALGRQAGGQEAALEHEYEQWITALGQPAIAAALSQAAVTESRPELGTGLSVECLVESRFAQIVGARSLTGAIDRTVLYRRGGQVVAADVIDFKTDHLGARSPLRSAYVQQLRDYVQVTAQRFGAPGGSIRGVLIWLTTGQVEEISFSDAGPTASE